VLASAVQLTVPFPVPEVGLGWIQEGYPLAVHVHPVGDPLTVTLPEPPVLATFALVGFNVAVAQTGGAPAACVTVNV
jgi:hypothetical protein